MANANPGNEARYLFEVDKKPLRVVDFWAREALSTPFRVDLSLAAEQDFDLDAVIGKDALLTIITPQGERYFHGVVATFTHTGVKGRFFLYRARVVPSFWLLSLEQDCRIFQGKSVQDIVEGLHQDAGINADRCKFTLQGKPKPREYCVQYRETDLNFASRLLAEEGIYYFFEHAKDKHVLNLADTPSGYQKLPGGDKFKFLPSGGMVATEDFVSNIVFSRQVLPGKVTLRDFNFEKPSVDLTADAKQKPFDALETYEYPGDYAAQGDGKALAKLRLEESTKLTDWAEGDAACPRFCPGYTFTLDVDRKKFKPGYLLVVVEHRGTQPQSLEELSSGGDSAELSCRFTAIPADVPFRPDRAVAKPIVHGVQTAIVVGSPGEEIYTDSHGRVKVQFHWDRLGKKDEKSSCWVRVSQLWAGASFGAIHIPRIGQEVIVDFLEGDVDRPIIVGRVYHGSNPPPYALPGEKTKSGFKSSSSTGGGGSNELRFEDKKGQEEVYLHAQKDANFAINNNHTLSVGANQSETVGGDKSQQVTGNRDETISKSVTITVGENQTENITKNDSLTVGINQDIKVGSALKLIVGTTSQEIVGAAKTVGIGGLLSETIGGAKTVTVGAVLEEQSGSHLGLTAGGKMVLTAAKDFTLSTSANAALQAKDKMAFAAKEILIEAKDKLTIKQGGAEITLKGGEINIKAKKITIKSSGDVIIKGSKVQAN